IRDFHVTGVQTCALPIFYFGQPLVTTELPARGVDAVDLLKRHPITNALLLPNDLALLHEAVEQGASTQGFALRAVCSAGDTLPRSEERRVGKVCRSEWTA